MPGKMLSWGKMWLSKTLKSDGLKSWVFEVSLADLQNDEITFRKFKLIIVAVQGKNCLTNFHDMDLTCDIMCSIVKNGRPWLKLTLMSRLPMVTWFICSVWVLHRKSHQPDSEDFLGPAPAGAPDPQEDDGNHYPRGADKWLGKGDQ